MVCHNKKAHYLNLDPAHSVDEINCEQVARDGGASGYDGCDLSHFESRVVDVCGIGMFIGEVKDLSEEEVACVEDDVH